jgi:hypothetical protein
MENEWKLISLSFENYGEKIGKMERTEQKQKKKFIRRTTFIIRLNSNFPIILHSS